MNTKKNPNKHYSATVDAAGVESLMQIDALYSANPSGIASKLLQAVANVGPDFYPEFMREVSRVEQTLVSQRSAAGDTPRSLATVSPEQIQQAHARLERHGATSRKTRGA